MIAEGEKKQLAALEDKIAAGDNRREIIEQYTNLDHLTWDIVEELIDYILVGKRIPGTRDVPHRDTLEFLRPKAAFCRP